MSQTQAWARRHRLQNGSCANNRGIIYFAEDKQTLAGRGGQTNSDRAGVGVLTPGGGRGDKGRHSRTPSGCQRTSHRGVLAYLTLAYVLFNTYRSNDTRNSRRNAYGEVLLRRNEQEFTAKCLWRGVVEAKRDDGVARLVVFAGGLGSSLLSAGEKEASFSRLVINGVFGERGEREEESWRERRVVMQMQYICLGSRYTVRGLAQASSPRAAFPPFVREVVLGVNTWKPQVTPLAEVKTTPEGIPVATATSLAANKQPVRHIGSNHNTVARPFPGFTGSQPAYAKGVVTLNQLKQSATDSPSLNGGGGNTTTSSSRSSSRHASGSTSPTGLAVQGTGISLNKENAKNFLRMTLDKENVNSMNVNAASSQKAQKSPSNDNLFSSQFLNNNGAVGGSVGQPRKYSLASNASSCSSSDTDHDALTRRNNEVNGQQIVNAQYNSPLNLYSEDNIAETLSAQAEVLGKGCLGVNFMKNEKQYDGKTSDVLRMVQEMDKNPAPETEDSGPGPAGTRSVRAPETKPKPEGGASPAPLTKCSECERPITGVFVRIKNKNLHADCFRCSTCGSSLKNVGYYNINDKLYCDVHAKQAARHNPPAPNMEPVVVKPGAAPPAGAGVASPSFNSSSGVLFWQPFKPPVGGVRILPLNAMGSPSMPSPTPIPNFAPPPHSSPWPQSQNSNPLHHSRSLHYLPQSQPKNRNHSQRYTRRPPRFAALAHVLSSLLVLCS
ncbi:putative PDZ and LIM domain protein Zasp [Penaeus vannamei]|uniref:Putative PDZ and LIM domain protein Zasp n=1 Tax=Penaeus vannamei TaxID=6689 RepID=A0A423TZI4_PENVA|nr:putative PDZ and LIM domain protein Zasp [Penaeus vannamei]